MGDTSLIRTAVLVALLAAVGFVAVGRAPAAESSAIVEAVSAACYGKASISFPPL